MKTYTNKRGNKVTSHFKSGIDRYHFDFEQCTSKKGWQQYDTTQDAWYFGIWVNLKERKILTYAEGDIDLTECKDDAHLQAELDVMAECYGPPPPAFTCLDLHAGTITKHYDTRPTIEEGATL